MHLRSSVRLAGLCCALAAAVSGCAATPSHAPHHEPTSTVTSSPWGAHVGLSDFKAVLDGEDVVILDVRTPGEFQSGHLPAAINLDVTNPDFASRIKDLDPEATYAIYCRSGQRSQAAQAQLHQHGIDQTVGLTGGMQVWDGPTEK